MYCNIDLLPDDIKEKALAYVNTIPMETPQERNLSIAFDWGETDEGRLYWSRVNEQNQNAYGHYDTYTVGRRIRIDYRDDDIIVKS